MNLLLKRSFANDFEGCGVMFAVKLFKHLFWGRNFVTGKKIVVDRIKLYENHSTRLYAEQ